MGRLSFHSDQHDLAVEWLVRAIRQDPRPEYLVSLGVVLQRSGRLEEAIKTFDKAVKLRPDAPESWKHLGTALADSNRPDQAVLCFQQAVTLDPSDWEAADKSASLLFQLRRLEEALCCFNMCDALQPNRASTLHMRALVKCGLDQYEDAFADITRAQALEPKNADICNNLGAVLQRFGRDIEALQWFERALTLRPNCPATFMNKAGSLSHLRRFDEAFAVYQEVTAIDPGNADPDWSIAMLHLLTGNFEAGWAGREVRWKVPHLGFQRINFSQPLWLGKEPVDGKTILLHVDEGLGDTIQFARYVPMLAALGANVVLAVDDALCPLLSELPGVTKCLSFKTGTFPDFDMYCPMSSLPLAFGTTLETVPSAVPYLPAPPRARLEAWSDRLGPYDKLRIGLVWSGNPKHKNDHFRSVRLRALSSILELDATFISLQKDPRPEDQAVLRERTEIVDLTAQLTDFVETAALISCLDLVITVDTSIAHLAGALGCPTWILLPYVPDYRWLLDRDDSPWYPTVRLFRQTTAGDYASIIDRVRAELAAAIAARSHKAA
jgi:tetratricopeptide (TPR) repeat protein